MKILFFISEDFYVVSHRFELLLALSKEYNEKITLVTKVKTYEMLLAKDFNLINYDIKRESNSIINFAYSSYRYNRIIKNVKPDLVISIAIKPIILTLFALIFNRDQKVILNFAGLGIVFTEKCSNFKLTILRTVFEFVFYFLKSKKYKYLFQNKSDYQLFVTRNWSHLKNSYIIPGSGVILDKYPKRIYPEHYEVVRFGFAGRLLKHKGLEEVVRAIEFIKINASVKVKFLIAGIFDETNPDSIDAKSIEEWKDRGVIDEIQTYENMIEFYTKIDVFTFPSTYREGIPKVLLEASAAGLPMIVYNNPGCIEVVEHMRNGLVVKNNSYIRLAENMLFFIQNSIEIKNFGNYARAKAEKYYSLDSVVMETKKVINDLM